MFSICYQPWYKMLPICQHVLPITTTLAPNHLCYFCTLWFASLNQINMRQKKQKKVKQHHDNTSFQVFLKNQISPRKTKENNWRDNTVSMHPLKPLFKILEHNKNTVFHFSYACKLQTWNCFVDRVLGFPGGYLINTK